MSDAELLAEVIALQAEWAAAFKAREYDRLAALYTDAPLFYGSTPDLHTSRAGVRGYFDGLPDAAWSAQYDPPQLRRLGPDTLVASGSVVFERQPAGEDAVRHPYRMTHVLVREAAGWRIAAHHASPVPSKPL